MGVKGKKRPRLDPKKEYPLPPGVGGLEGHAVHDQDASDEYYYKSLTKQERRDIFGDSAGKASAKKPKATSKDKACESSAAHPPKRRKGDHAVMPEFVSGLDEPLHQVRKTQGGSGDPKANIQAAGSRK